VPTHNSAAAGRNCPLRYRYLPETFRSLQPVAAETAYIIGGLYGNSEALHALLKMKADDEARGNRVSLVFNGDFNWFNVDTDSFARINTAVLGHLALRGNVETELDGIHPDAGCGCAYPAYVGDDTVQRSNVIMARLQAAAAAQPALTQRLTALPTQLLLSVGGLNIGVIHGDPESLAGWGLAVERLEPADAALRARLGCDEEEVTPCAQVTQWLQRAAVRAFACSHTCLPFVQDFLTQGRRCLVMNNGAAGMPNFAGTRHGVVTRISSRGAGPCAALYATVVDGVSFEAVAVHYDHERWMQRFAANWPPGSAAHASYAGRLLDGPAFSPANALRLGAGTGLSESAS
jgi:hypothetical protein